MAQIISGKLLSQKLKDNMKKEVETLVRPPHLVVILVGDNPASVSYVNGKAKACQYVGIKDTIIRLESNVSEKKIIRLIQSLNRDSKVDGILVQLPLPKHIDERKVLESIAIEKDVDGFHPSNVAKLWLKEPCILPCTPKGIIKLLDEAGVEVSGKEAVVIGRSNIVGLPIAKLLLDRNATVTITHSKSVDLGGICRRADILIVAVGKPRVVSAGMVKEGAVVIDVGVNRGEDGKLCGDVDFEAVKDIASVITKVPGGVGPMTITCLMENVIEAYKMKMEALKNE